MEDYTFLTPETRINHLLNLSKMKKYCPNCDFKTEHDLEILNIEKEIVSYNDACKGTNLSLPHTEKKITSLYQWSLWKSNQLTNEKQEGRNSN